MGVRKKNNAAEKLRRMDAKVVRDRKATKRITKTATAGQKLHATMHGRNGA